jgi:hypothetical protein
MLDVLAQLIGVGGLDGGVCKGAGIAARVMGIGALDQRNEKAD